MALFLFLLYACQPKHIDTSINDYFELYDINSLAFGYTLYQLNVCNCPFDQRISKLEHLVNIKLECMEKRKIYSIFSLWL